ncbi:MAG: dicarboxylate/amino acid:cation symporter [Microvirga sp.]
MATATATAGPHSGKWYRHLYAQVLTAIVLGVLLGHFYPSLGEAMKPLGDAFIKMIKMVIAPIIFFTVVHGIASMKDMKKVGRVGLKALIYFELVTTAALIIGLLVINLWKPGVGMAVDPSAIDTKAIASFTAKAKEQSTIHFLMDIIPSTVVGAFATGEILQVLFFAVLFAFGLQALGERGETVLRLIDVVSHVFFRIVGYIMKLAPIGAFGAMAFTIGKYGVGTLLSLGNFMLAFYTTCLLFIFLVLGTIARLCGFSILKFIRYIKEELLIVLGTSSSESVLPRMIAKMENLGCEPSVVGLVIPTGYSFNLDGFSIYLTLAAVFIAQATNTPLSTVDLLTILGVSLITSKGAHGIPGSAIVILAATLTAIPDLPVVGLVLILAVDWFMGIGRALTNMMGNAVAAVAIGAWEGDLDRERARRVLGGHVDAALDEAQPLPVPPVVAPAH